MKTLLLIHHVYIDTPSLVKIRWKKTKYRRICEAVKPQEVQNVEDTLINSRSLNLQNFEEYFRNRALITELLQRYYTETATNYLTTYFAPNTRYQ